MKLRIAGVTFSYGSISILNDVTAVLFKGEMLGLLGPNGAGKSTLIRCIDRILKPQRGSILLNGQETKKMSRQKLAQHIGYVPQAGSNGFPTTVFDTVLMGRRPHASWGSADSDIEKVIDVLELLEIKSFALRDFRSLSGGEKQKVILARALVQEPDVLLLDEPTSDLDIRHQLEVMEILKDIVEEKEISAIVAMHDLNLAARYTDKIVMLHAGSIFAGGYPETVLTPENIKSVYGVETAVTTGSNGLQVLLLRPVKVA